MAWPRGGLLMVEIGLSLVNDHTLVTFIFSHHMASLIKIINEGQTRLTELATDVLRGKMGYIRDWLSICACLWLSEEEDCN